MINKRFYSVGHFMVTGFKSQLDIKLEGDLIIMLDFKSFNKE
jgi:hypothetical protein